MSITTDGEEGIAYNKYSNRSCRCRQNHIHRSRFEARVCNEIHLEYHNELQDGTVEIETEKRFDLTVLGKKVAEHYMDFFLTFEGGRELAIEAKGYADKVWPLKKKLFEALYPDIDYEVRYNKPVNNPRKKIRRPHATVRKNK